MGLKMVITDQTGTTMSLRQLWWDWNPVRLRRLMRLNETQILANINLANLYHCDLVATKKVLEQTNQMLDLAHKELRVLRYELEAKKEAENES
jgi:hypothetical protein